MKRPITERKHITHHFIDIYKEIHETYMYYDRPVIFSKKNPYYEDDFTLFMLIDETNTHETWMAVDLTEERLRQISTGEIDLRDAWTKAEYGYVHILRSRSGAARSGRIIECKDIREDSLPTEGARLNGTWELE